MATETLAVNLLMNARQYKREAREAATATGQIGASANKTGTATGQLDKQMTGLARTAKFAVGGIAAAAVAGFARDSIRAASDLNESINAVNRTFGDAAPAIMALGETAANSFGLAQSEFNAFAVQFSNFGQTVAAGTGRTVGSVIDELTTRIADFASVMNLDIPEAAEKFQSGLAGQVEPLRVFGIDVSAAAVNTKALELGLADSTSALTEQDKVLARYQLIMEQTAKTAGDFAETSDEYANATRIAEARMKDFQATVGGFVIPILGELVSVGTDVITILDGIANALPGVEGGFAGLDVAARLVNVALMGFPTLFGSVAKAFEDTEADSREFRIELEQFHRQQILTGKGADQVAAGLDDVSAAMQRVQFEKAIGGFEDTGEAAEDASDSLARFQDEVLALTDPVFAFAQRSRDAGKAQEAFTEAVKEHGAASPEAEEALLGLLEAEGRLNAAALEYAQVAGPELDEAVTALGISAGLTFDQIESVEGILMRLDGTTANAQLIVDLLAKFRGGQQDRAAFERAISSNLPRSTGPSGIPALAHGGNVTAGQPYWVGEQGVAELFIPDQSGTVVPRTQAVPAGEAGRSTVVHLNGDIYGYDDFVEKVGQAGVTLQRLGR